MASTYWKSRAGSLKNKPRHLPSPTLVRTPMGGQWAAAGPPPLPPHQCPFSPFPPHQLASLTPAAISWLQPSRAHLAPSHPSTPLVFVAGLVSRTPTFMGPFSCWRSLEDFLHVQSHPCPCSPTCPSTKRHLETLKPTWCLCSSSPWISDLFPLSYFSLPSL